jgi:hypothetical protein
MAVNSLSQSGMLTRARPGNLKPFHSGVGKAAIAWAEVWSGWPVRSRVAEDQNIEMGI